MTSSDTHDNGREEQWEGWRCEVERLTDSTAMLTIYRGDEVIYAERMPSRVARWFAILAARAQAGLAQRYRDALEFYAIREAYLHDDNECSSVCTDEGQTARDALTMAEETK